MKVFQLWTSVLFFPLLASSVVAGDLVTDENTNKNVTDQICQQGEGLNPRPARSIPFLSKLLFGGTNTYFTLHMGQVPPDHPLIKYPNPIQLTARKTNDKLLIALPLDENGKKLNPKKVPSKGTAKHNDGGDDVIESDMLASASSHHDHDADGKTEKEMLPSPMESAASTLTYTELQDLYEPFIHEPPTTAKPKDPLKPALMHLPGMQYIADEDGNSAVVPVPGYTKIIVTGSNRNVSTQQAFELPEMLPTPLPQINDAGNLQLAPTIVSSFQQTYLASEEPKNFKPSPPDPLPVVHSNVQQDLPQKTPERPLNVKNLAYGPPPVPLPIKGLNYGPPPKLPHRPIMHRQPPKLNNVAIPLSAPNFPVVVKELAFRPPEGERPSPPLPFPQTEHILHLRPPLPIALAKNSQNALPPAPVKDILHGSPKFHPKLPLAVPTEVILNLRAPLPSSNLPLPVPTEEILNMRAPLPPGEILHLRPPLPVPAEKFVDESQKYVSSMANMPEITFKTQPSTVGTPTSKPTILVPTTIADLIGLGTNEDGQKTGINGFPAVVETKTVKSDGSYTITYTPVYIAGGPFEWWRGQNLPQLRRRKFPHRRHNHHRRPQKRQEKPRAKHGHNLHGVKMLDNQWNPIQRRQGGERRD